MIFLMGSTTHASDNRSAPNVFSSGSTISSSQMNENFNFLASEIREKEVNCKNLKLYPMQLMKVIIL